MSSKKKIIFIIDDDEEILSFLEKMLSIHNYKIIKFNNGFDCLKKIREIKPDLILTDLMLPELSGYAIIKILKDNLETKEIPIIMLSCKGALNEVNKGLEYGAEEHVSKPIDLNLLLPKITKTLNKYNKDKKEEEN